MDLSLNKIRDEGSALLCSSLNQLNNLILLIMHFEKCNIKWKGAAYFVELLKSVKNIRYIRINLYENEVNRE